MKWDYIVVGAGSAGSALVYELAQTGRSVLLLEAGGSDRSAFIKLPAAVWRIQPRHDWGYRAGPDPTRNGISEHWHRGRVLGGTSSINGMVYVRGASADFDRWSAQCAHQGQWSGEKVNEVFKQLECSDQPSVVRGHGGPLFVRTVKHPHRVTSAFVESASASGVSFNSDYNAADQEGVGYLQFTQRRGLRWSAADAFLRPALRSRRVKLMMNAVVERFEVQDGRATAVIFRHRGRVLREAAREVILSAGAINSPKLLMLSGIGDPEELQRHRIDVVLDLPGVGRNLREHALTQVSFRSKVPTYNLTEGLLQKCAIAGKYLLRQEGPIAAAYEAAAFLKTSPSLPSPDIQVFFAPIGWGDFNGKTALAPYPALKICIIRSHSQSSGRIRLSSKDADAPPDIECRLLESDEDLNTLIRGIETVREIVHQGPMARLIDAELTPGEQIGTNEGLENYVRQNTGAACHPIGTCRMGLGADAVVGPDLKVRGTENLWIADASIMPDAISANLNGPCMMIGAKLGKHLAKGPAP